MGKETEQKQEIVNQGVHTYSQEEAYVWPEEPVLREQLEWFQDQKLALRKSPVYAGLCKLCQR